MGRLVRTYIRAGRLTVGQSGFKISYSTSIYWSWSIESDGAIALTATGQTYGTNSYGLKIVPISLTENVKAFYLDADINDLTHGVRQGAMRVDLDRESTSVMTGSDGNPDTAAYIQYNQRGVNASYARGRALNIVARARASSVWIKGVTIGVRNDSGSVLSDILYGAEIVMENYGSLATSAYFVGLAIQHQQEAAGASKAAYEWAIYIKNANASVGQPLDAGIKFERSNSTNTGFKYLIDATGTNAPIPSDGAVINLKDDATIADANGSVGAAAGFIVIAIDGTQQKLRTYAMS